MTLPNHETCRLDFILPNPYYSARSGLPIPNIKGEAMKPKALNKNKIGKTAILATLFSVAILSILSGCAAVQEKKSSGVIISREATEIWHSYEVLPNYNYYITGAASRPWHIIGIDEKYHLTSKLWEPVDLTPEMVDKWINYYRPRVGYSVNSYGSFIINPEGERIGLWYSVRKYNHKGSVEFGENNQISAKRPARQWY
jgi:hypothetical protein